MHQQEQKLQNMHQFSSFFYQFLKKVIQIALSFYVFSLFLQWPPFISYLSTLSSQIFSLSTEKNYIFLLCNGILVFIAKYSGHTIDTRPPALPDTSLDHDLMYKAYRQSMQLSTENSVSDKDVVANNGDENENRTDIIEAIQVEDVEDKHVLHQNIYETLMEEEYDVISNDYDKEYMTDNFDCWSHEKQQNYTEVVEQEHEEEAIAKMSTEELNRKFDDFIRKMKEDLRIEARQQLIVV